MEEDTDTNHRPCRLLATALADAFEAGVPDRFYSAWEAELRREA
jgi:DNA primase